MSFNTCSRTTSGSGRSSTSWCSRSRRRPAIRSCWVCSPPSGSARQAVRARRAHAQDPRGGGRGRQRHRAHRHLRARDPGGLRLLPGLRSGRTCSSPVATSSSTRRPRSHPRARSAAPSDGARKLDSRTNFFYMATGITPAMCMRLTGIGSQYIYAMRDSEGAFFDGARSYKLTLPADIPESRFWSVILYDRQTRSMLQTDQHLPRLGSQSGTVETNPTARPTSTSAQRRPRGKRTTGCKPCPARAGGRSCGSTTRSSRSSTRAGGRARSSPPTADTGETNSSETRDR